MTGRHGWNYYETKRIGLQNGAFWESVAYAVFVLKKKRPIGSPSVPVLVNGSKEFSLENVRTKDG